MPSDAQLMQIMIDDLNNTSLPMEDRLHALQELLILVEPTDIANDLNKLGGLAVIIKDLDHPEFDVRKLSAWVIGKASQNNPIVQKQELFYAEAGDLIIQFEAAGEGEIPLFRNRHLLKSVVGLMASSDLDLQEKTLVAVKNLLLLRASETQVFKDFCGLDVASERMRQHLDHLMEEEESQREYAMDVESLCRDVELTFQKKLRMANNRLFGDNESQHDGRSFARVN